MKRFLIVCFLFLLCVVGYAQKYTLVSPDKKLSAEIESNRQGIQLKMMKGADPVFTLSDLALVTDQQQTAPLQVKKTKRSTVTEDIRPVIKEKSETYKNEYNELLKKFNISFDEKYLFDFFDAP